MTADAEVSALPHGTLLRLLREIADDRLIDGSRVGLDRVRPVGMAFLNTDVRHSACTTSCAGCSAAPGPSRSGAAAGS